MPTQSAGGEDRIPLDTQSIEAKGLKAMKSGNVDTLGLFPILWITAVHSVYRPCDQTTNGGHPRITCQVDDSSIRTFALGDWGGSDSDPYVTEAQTQCANFISTVGPTKRPQFFTNTGDNFYYNGVKNEYDPRFKSTFDDVFLYGKNESIPWYIIAGNHDWYGNVSAQIEYRNHNPRWKFPDYSYSVLYHDDHNRVSAHFVFVDAIILCGNTWDDEANGTAKNGKKGKKLDKPKGPKDAELSNRTVEWIEHQLRNSRAKYLFVVGHYPVFSMTRYRVSMCVVSKIQPLLDAYKVTAYISGHEHNLQYMTTKTSSHLVHHIITGGGHLLEGFYTKLDMKYNPWKFSGRYFFPETVSPTVLRDNGALVWLDLQEKEGVVQFYNCSNPNPLYNITLTPRL